MIILVTGQSNAGKDTTFELIRDLVPTEVLNIKFSYPMKKMIAYAYDVTVDQLNDKSFRYQNVPGENFTYSDVMVRCFHHFPNIDRNMIGDMRTDFGVVVKSYYIRITAFD